MVDPMSPAKSAIPAPPSHVPCGDKGANRWWKRMLCSSSETLTHKHDIIITKWHVIPIGNVCEIMCVKVISTMFLIKLFIYYYLCKYIYF